MVFFRLNMTDLEISGQSQNGPSQAASQHIITKQCGYCKYKKSRQELLKTCCIVPTAALKKPRGD
jgi:hypothetical protein